MARDYADQIKQLLPPGPIWESLGDVLQSVVDALAVEFARVDARGIDLESEMMPATSVELISNWETALGLPDDGCTLPTDLAERQAAAQARFVARGRDNGAGAIFLQRIAAEMSYTLEITRWRRAPFNTESTTEEAVDVERALLMWEMHASHQTDELDDQLECALRHAAINDLTLAIPLAPIPIWTYTRAAGATHTDIITGAVVTLGTDEPGISWIGV